MNVEIICYITKYKLTNYKGNSIMSDESRNVWNWGFTSGAENWNGRLAMIGFVSALAIELISGQGVLHFWGIL